jgi:site-specific DNA-methyltransferase (adenine-specific)
MKTKFDIMQESLFENETAIAPNRCYALPELWNGNCLELMKKIPDGSIDAIITDPPYGTTACKWDSIIDLDLLWRHYNRIIKDNGAIVLTASQPFTTKLISSNYSMFRYEWIYSKTKSTGFMNANKMPMKQHENVLVFYKKLPTYNPIQVFVGIKDKRKTFNPAKLKESNIYNNSGIKNTVYHVQTL